MIGCIFIQGNFTADVQGFGVIDARYAHKIPETGRRAAAASWEKELV